MCIPNGRSCFAISSLKRVNARPKAHCGGDVSKDREAAGMSCLLVGVILIESFLPRGFANDVAQDEHPSSSLKTAEAGRSNGQPCPELGSCHERVNPVASLDKSRR